ncbi:putative polypeptide N-acetylgalactosaminyltransferase-like protein 3 [Sinocyclocheilus anshuiensis]|uniref:putative polypeptide N-acetylgalactosaminyltransferase-like protein 3 n=1 Tax=Sinocyclocheilus anshuiensis TaxID=1608454 RepID=UPI0007B9E729|nr:PREDICTED: putative polypeptide N-acetylgalactosaminyltransferase-like protein 3 [Sinocyclocheilus anshuiensis]
MMRFAGFRTPKSFMAFVMRRWKILMVLNVFTMAGFITFWGKCNLRTTKAVGQQAVAADVRGQTHLNGSAQETSITHDVLLKRLGSLEDVVYRQLNGLSKSLGLIEGFGGRGRGGLPATLMPEEEKEAKYLREKYGYNAFLSDKISLDRSIPDYRPSKCKKAFYSRDLPQISMIFIFLVTSYQDGLAEFPAWQNWAEPVLSRIKENHKRIILPSIDNIKDETFELERYENSGHGYNWELWCMYISPPKQWWDEGDTSAPIRTPAMIGCSFVVNREYFGELGLLDAGMDVYGGENIELGIRVWLCGGSMEVLPCSRVAHIARTKKPYHSNIAFHTRRNALRVAEVWMDQYKSNVYLAWNLPMKNHGIDYGDISQRLAFRKRLQCKNFEWYLDNIYPEMRIYNNTLFYGEIRNTNVTHLCVDQGIKENHTATLHPCHGWGPQLGRYTKEGYLFLGPLGSTGEDTRCVVDDKISSYPQLLNCEKVSSVRQKTWHFAQNEAIINRATGRCLEVVPANIYFGYALILRSCTGQKWNIKNLMKQD